MNRLFIDLYLDEDVDILVADCPTRSCDGCCLFSIK